MARIVIDQELCTGCGKCAEVCTMEIFTLENEKAKSCDVENCMVCRVCETECMVGAIHIFEA